MLIAMTALVVVAAAARGTWSPCGLSMISAVNPLAERGRGNRYWLTALWFVAGAVAGGLLLGAGTALLALVIAPLPAAVAGGLGAAGCLVAVAADTGTVRLPLHPRQVNERWLEQYRRWIYAAGFGFQIGTGFATYIMTAATYLVVLLPALTGSPGVAVAAGAGFGLVRGSAVLLAARCRTPEALRTLHRRLDELATGSLTAVVAVSGLAAVLLAFSAAGPFAAAVAAGAAAVAYRGRIRGRRPEPMAVALGGQRR